MATQIHNQDVIQNLSKAAQLQPGVDAIPMMLSPLIAPTLQINPLKKIRLVAADCTNATSATVLTASTTLKTYITGMELTVTKDVTATAVNSSVNIVAVGTGSTAVRALTINHQTLTVGQGTTVQKEFNNPIEIEQGSLITLTNSTNVANITASCVVYYYTE